jgi:hypothetical protein
LLEAKTKIRCTIKIYKGDNIQICGSFMNRGDPKKDPKQVYDILSSDK